MSPQADYVVSNGTGAAVRSDINGQLAAIVSNNSGASAPATTYAYMLWADTSTNLLKLRNGANSAWITVGDLTAANLGLATLASPTFTGTATIPTLTVSTAANIPLGSAASPTLYFTGDSNTGLYSPGADQVAISTNGTRRFQVSSDGTINVFAANKTPSGGGNSVIYATDTQAVDVGGSIAFGGYYIGTSSDTEWAQIAGRKENSTSGNYAGYLQFSTRANGGPTIERLRITSAGLVGIGTNSITAGNLLEVRGRIESRNDSTSEYAFYARGGYASGGEGGIRHAAGLLDLRTAGVYDLTFSTNNTERARIDTSGRLLLGTSSTRTIGFWDTPQFLFEGTDYQKSSLCIYNNQNDIYGAVISLGHSRGTSVGSNTIVQNNDYLGALAFHGSDGGNEVRAAEITAYVDGTPGVNDMPCRLVFSTTADGASSPTERMRINSVGYFKASDTGTYRSSAGSYHEFNQSIDNNGLVSRASFSTYSASMFWADAVRAQNSAYAFFLATSGDSADNEFKLRGDGNAFADGTWTGGGADYAEYFEWSDSNPNDEDRRGISVVLDGDKIREAVAGEDPIGVISGNPSVVGDAAWNKWSGKYLRDEFGSYLLDENGDRQLNPAYDPDQKYIPREQRPEWDCVGLMGKLRILKGQVTGSRWIKMRDISDSVEEWLVR